MLPPTTRELDACGIGFVADAQGRPSRAIVAAALRGLACVKHRGAVAADARTADGSGLLVDGPVGLAITSTAYDGAGYSSKEGPVNQRPELVVECASP